MTWPERSCRVRLGRRTASSADSGSGRSRQNHSTVTAAARDSQTEAMKPQRNSHRDARAFRDRLGGSAEPAARRNTALAQLDPGRVRGGSNWGRVGAGRGIFVAFSRSADLGDGSSRACALASTAKSIGVAEIRLWLGRLGGLVAASLRSCLLHTAALHRVRRFCVRSER